MPRIPDSSRTSRLGRIWWEGSQRFTGRGRHATPPHGCCAWLP
jgi:hypothetical protein